MMEWEKEMSVQTDIGSITATRRTLNWLSMMSGDVRTGVEKYDEFAWQVSMQIHNALEAVGHYEGASLDEP